jgi:hypothetical protein
METVQNGPYLFLLMGGISLGVLGLAVLAIGIRYPRFTNLALGAAAIIYGIVFGLIVALSRGEI